jgi:hypothetical protein
MRRGRRQRQLRASEATGPRSARAEDSGDGNRNDNGTGAELAVTSAPREELG